MIKKQKRNTKKPFLQRLGSKGVFVLGIAVILTSIGILVANLQTQGYKSKAAEVQVNCKQLCDEKLPKHMTYTDDCAAKIAAGGTEPCGCEKACLKVVEAMKGEMTCEKACTSQLRVMRGKICVNILCPAIQGQPVQDVP